jgi:hypothetical protein
MFRMTEDGWIEVDAREPVHGWSLLPCFTEPAPWPIEPISPALTPTAARGDPSLRSDVEPGGAALRLLAQRVAPGDRVTKLFGSGVPGFGSVVVGFAAGSGAAGSGAAFNAAVSFATLVASR